VENPASLIVKPTGYGLHTENTMSDDPLIDIENATFYRGQTRVFDGLSLTIAQHEQVAILGPNGAGKTTLLKVINREIYPAIAANSRVRILGRSTWNVWELRAQIGIVSDDLQSRYNPRTTGLDVVLSGFFASVGSHGSLAAKVTTTQRERTLAVMHELGVEAFADVPLQRMSTGQQRRCLLARALVHEPATLVFDEPTAGLDLAASFDYLTRIRRLIAAGRSIVLVTHHLNEIPPDIERVILLRAGRIVADGTKQAVLTVANLEATYQVPMRLKIVDGYYLAYPAA
jgi:iron complex transport system ATP-binding protein